MTLVTSMFILVAVSRACAHHWFASGGDWSLELGNVWRLFWFSKLGKGMCYWHPVLRGQESCSAPTVDTAAPTAQNDPVPKVSIQRNCSTAMKMNLFSVPHPETHLPRELEYNVGYFFSFFKPSTQSYRDMPPPFLIGPELTMSQTRGSSRACYPTRIHWRAVVTPPGALHEPNVDLSPRKALGLGQRPQYRRPPPPRGSELVKNMEMEPRC